MPKAVTEITAGNQFTRSGGTGTGNDNNDRVFRIILNSPTEVFNPETDPDVNTKIGDKHPVNDVYCTSYGVRFEGDIRLVMLCTMQYGAAAGSISAGNDPNSQPPEVRPANWTTNTSLVEQPVYRWRKRTDITQWAAETSAENSAGDIYEAVSQLTPIVNISITQSETLDPTKHNLHAGKVNSEVIVLGSLTMNPHTVMFRGVSNTPVVENWGGVTLRRWQCTYEFAYKPNVTSIVLGGIPTEVELGWDIAVPQTGYNVICFTPVPGAASQDSWGQPLKHAMGKVVIPLSVPEALASGDKARAMVRVADVENRGLSQAPSASPIALNDDGTARLDTANPKVLVYGYAVQPELNLTQTLQLRLL